MADLVVVCDTLEIGFSPSVAVGLPREFATAWLALSARMLGAPNETAPWSALVRASRRPCMMSDGGSVCFEWSAPLPYPVRLSAAELACGRLSVAPLPADTTLMLSAYTGTLTLTLSSGVWEPSFCEGEDGRPRVALSSPKGSMAPTSARLALEFLTRVPYHHQPTTTTTTNVMMRMTSPPPIVALTKYWHALVAEVSATFST